MPAKVNRKPAILQIVPSLVSGGVERGTVDVAAALVRGGWRAIVASAGGPLVRELERAGAEHITLPLASKNPLTMRRNAGRIARLVGALPADLVHVRSRAPAWSCWWARQRVDFPLVTTFHAAYGANGRLKRRYNSVMARGDRVIAISDFVAEHVRTTYGVEDDRLVTIPRGVDLARFDPAAVTANRLIQLASAWRLSDEFPVIMLPGRITRWKGHEMLLEAVARLGRRDLQVLFVGSDDRKARFRRELEAGIYKLGLDGVVHLVGDCRDMPAALMLADIVVAPSTEPEGFGRVAIEGQAMGRPVVASDHGGARETIRHGETGLLVPPGNAAALADALDVALSLDEARRIDLGARARDWVAENFDNRLMCERTLALYEQVLFGGDRDRGLEPSAL